jgi:hypothetical protein
LGGRPDFSADLTIIMKRMVVTPYRFWLGTRTVGRPRPAKPRGSFYVE